MTDREQQTSAEAAGSLRDRLSTTPIGGAREGDDATAGAVGPGAGRSTSQRSMSSAAQAEHEEQLGAGHAGASYGEGPATVAVPAAEPRLEDIDRKAERLAERQIIGCALATLVGSIGFVIVYFALDPGTTLTFANNSPISPGEFQSFRPQTPLFGLTLGIALFGLGAAPIIWAKKLMPAEEAVQQRETFRSSDAEREQTAEVFAEGVADTGIKRRTLMRTALLLGGGAITLPAFVPLLSLGPYTNKVPRLRNTAFGPGVRLVTFEGIPVRIGEIQAGGFVTVYPEGHLDLESKNKAATMLIRLRPGDDHPLPGRENFSYESHVAYSKICTHAGCPLGLYEQQTHHILCPCHQSTFLVTEHARPIFGPAARPLPQLPISINEEGYFIAQGDFPEATGPSFWER